MQNLQQCHEVTLPPPHQTLSRRGGVVQAVLNVSRVVAEPITSGIRELVLDAIVDMPNTLKRRFTAA